jgi:hypothetical protein
MAGKQARVDDVFSSGDRSALTMANPKSETVRRVPLKK